MSGRLVCWMDVICMPGTALRMGSVQVVHIYRLLAESCNFIALSDAMCTLLYGLVWVDEGDHSSSYCSHLHEACTMLNGMIRCYFHSYFNKATSLFSCVAVKTASAVVGEVQVWQSSCSSNEK